MEKSLKSSEIMQFIYLLEQNIRDPEELEEIINKMRLAVYCLECPSTTSEIGKVFAKGVGGGSS